MNDKKLQVKEIVLQTLIDAKPLHHVAVDDVTDAIMQVFEPVLVHPSQSDMWPGLRGVEQ